MDMDLGQKDLGGDGSLDLKLVGGDLVLVVSHASKGADANLQVKVRSDYFIDKLAAVIPGAVDDAILQVLKAALKS